MIRNALVLTCLLGVTTFASAGPIPWMYSVTMKPTNGADGIYLGGDTLWEYNPNTGIETGTFYHFLANVPANGINRSASLTPTEQFDLFQFGNGDRTLKEQLPSDQTYAPNAFVLEYAFTAGDNQTEIVRGTVMGSIYASGFFTTGTGNYTIGLDQTDEITVGGKKALVRFGVRESESQSSITMQVTEVAETPEPATLALGGLGLAGVLGARWKRRKAELV